MKSVLLQSSISIYTLLIISCTPVAQDADNESDNRFPAMTVHTKNSNTADGEWEILLSLANPSDKEITIPASDSSGSLTSFNYYDQQGSWASGTYLNIAIKIPAGETIEYQLMSGDDQNPFLSNGEKYTIRAVYFGLGLADDVSAAGIERSAFKGRPDLEYGGRMMEAEVTIPGKRGAGIDPFGDESDPMNNKEAEQAAP